MPIGIGDLGTPPTLLALLVLCWFFTGTKVQILTPEGVPSEPALLTRLLRRPQHTQFTCFTGTKVQILTQICVYIVNLHSFYANDNIIVSITPVMWQLSPICSLRPHTLVA